MLLVVLVAYVRGAAAGAATEGWSGAMFVPIGVLLVVGILVAARGTRAS